MRLIDLKSCSISTSQLTLKPVKKVVCIFSPVPCRQFFQKFSLFINLKSYDEPTCFSITLPFSFNDPFGWLHMLTNTFPLWQVIWCCFYFQWWLAMHSHLRWAYFHDLIICNSSASNWWKLCKEHPKGIDLQDDVLNSILKYREPSKRLTKKPL